MMRIAQIRAAGTEQDGAVAGGVRPFQAYPTGAVLPRPGRFVRFRRRHGG